MLKTENKPGLKAVEKEPEPEKAAGFPLTIREWKNRLANTSISDKVPDWRWPSKRQVRVNKRMSAGYPMEIRDAADALKTASGLSLAEQQRLAMAAFFKKLSQ